MVDNSKIIIFGCGGHARSVADVILYNAPDTQLIFVDINGKINEKIWEFDVVNHYVIGKNNFFIAIGNNKIRKEIFENLDTCNLITVTSKLAYVSKSASIGKGCFIGNFGHIGPNVFIGNNTIINTSSVIEHEVKIGSHSHIGPKVAISGRTEIGDLVFIGVGATVIDKITICSHVIIGAGATVINDIKEPGVYVGTPAKKLDF